MKAIFTDDIGIKSTATFLTGFVEPYAIIWLLLGIVIGHFISPYIREFFYERKRTETYATRQSR